MQVIRNLQFKSYSVYQQKRSPSEKVNLIYFFKGL
jgi:hypothetical protein